MNLVLRYAQVKHSQNIYRDYYRSGLRVGYRPLAEEGITESKIYKLPFRPRRILSAGSRACLQTATIFGERYKLEPQTHPSLLNIKHDLTKLVTESDFQLKEGVEKLRRNFIRDLYNDNLAEKKTTILWRMAALKQILDCEADTLVITHGLVLIVFRLYLLEGIKILAKSGKLVNYSNPFFGPLLGYAYPEMEEF
jgi:broad specificity phosphatase PhoE